MKIRRLFLLLCALLITSLTEAQVEKISLNSSNYIWEVKAKDDVPQGGLVISKPGFKFIKSVKGIVPGVVFTAYVNAGEEKNPDFGDNIYKVDEKIYNRPFWYRTEFRLSKKLQSGQHVWLNFDNTNRYADFYFNGHKISGTLTSQKDVSGHMIRSKFDVTKFLNQKGDNVIAVLIYDPDQKKTRTDKDPYGVACSPSYLAAAGWDWMPYIPGRLAGITGNVYLTVTRDVVLRDPWVRTFLPNRNRAELSVSSDLLNTDSMSREIVLRGTIQPGNIVFEKKVEISARSKMTVRFSPAEFSGLIINLPKLWWPNGYGAPNLYECKLQCFENNELTDSQDFRFGIRKYEYRIEKNAMDYPVLNLYVNGQRIFVKGGDWGMSEYLLRCHDKDYESKILLHKDLNYNMIRLWTGCVTDDEFYDYCDENGIMVWDDFWLYVSYNDVVDHEAFKVNARDKIRRLRNHPCIAVWCGANETHPVPDIDNALRIIVMEEDGNDRLYKSCSNQDALSGSGWWKDMPPRHHFETSSSNLAFNHPAYPYGSNYGYGFRSEMGMATFPTYESIIKFIPQNKLWPLPSDSDLINNDTTMWNYHFFGKSASNAGPVDYKKSVDSRYGESQNLREFCEKAQLVNLEDMRGMYEAWNDKMWEDASGLMIWMTNPAYPSFVWQTYDYYYDPTGCYWGAKYACESKHIQWNCLTNSVKVINTTSDTLYNVKAEARVYDINGHEMKDLYRSAEVTVPASDKADAFVLLLNSGRNEDNAIQFIRLKLTDSSNRVISENFYWRNRNGNLDYRLLNNLPNAPLSCKIKSNAPGHIDAVLENKNATVSFANRIRLVNRKTGERILPAIMSEGYVTLLPGESKEISITVNPSLLTDGYNILIKQYNQKERSVP